MLLKTGREKGLLASKCMGILLAQDVRCKVGAHLTICSPANANGSDVTTLTSFSDKLRSLQPGPCKADWTRLSPECKTGM